MTMLYPNPCYNKVCYKGTALLFENDARKPVFGIFVKVSSNQSRKLQRLARKLKFCLTQVQI